MAVCERVDVAMAFDEHYVPVAAAALASLLSHAGRQSTYHIHILSDALSARSAQLLCAMADTPHASVQVVACNAEELSGRGLGYSQFTRHTFTRLYLPQLLPDLKRVLYLDADTLVSADMAHLMSVDLQGYALGGVRGAMAAPPHSQLPQPQLRAQGYPYDTMEEYLRGHLGLNDVQQGRYFNSGVLVIDLPRYAARLKETLPQLMARQWAYADQDILNVAFADDHLLLDEGWNVFASARRPPSPYEQWYARHGCLPPIQHFAGMRNPCDNPRPDLGVCDEFWRVLAGTPFFAQALQRWVRACVGEQLRTLLQPRTAVPGGQPVPQPSPPAPDNRASRSLQR